MQRGGLYCEHHGAAIYVTEPAASILVFTGELRGGGGVGGYWGSCVNWNSSSHAPPPVAAAACCPAAPGAPRSAISTSSTVTKGTTRTACKCGSCAVFRH